MNPPTPPKSHSIEIDGVICATIRHTNAARCLPAVSPFRCASRPGNGDQKGALLQRFDVVVYAVVECDQFPGRKVDLLIREMNANLALQRMDRNSGVGMMPLHLCVPLHEDQNDPEVWILGKRFRALPRPRPPRVLRPKKQEFVGEIESQQWAGQVGQTGLEPRRLQPALHP
jgi:hypothetical protein